MLLKDMLIYTRKKHRNRRSSHFGWVMVAILPLLLCGPTQASTLFMDPVNGNDSNAGTSADTAVASVSKADEIASNQDLIVISNLNQTIASATWPSGLYQATMVNDAGITWTSGSLETKQWPVLFNAKYFFEAGIADSQLDALCDSLVASSSIQSEFSASASVSTDQAQEADIISINMTAISSPDSGGTPSSDTTAPALSSMVPTGGAIQAPLNTLVRCHVTDAGDGVNGSTVVMMVDGTTVYTGDVSSYTSSLGVCRRTGTSADYAYAFEFSEPLGYDQQVTVTVNASDLAGNAMSTVSSSFTTEMRAFGDNTAAVGAGNSNKEAVSSVTDSSGNKWMAWHTGNVGERDVYVGLVDGAAGEVSDPVRVTADLTDQCYPQLAIDADDRLYLVWQSNSRGVWDAIFGTSVDGINWTVRRVVDSDYNQIRPRIVCDTQSPSRAYVSFEDDRNGNWDIYLAYSNDLFVTNTTVQVTSNSAAQTHADLAVDASNGVYVVWQDERSGNSDIYGATSAGTWANQALITASGDQTDPVVAVDSLSSTAHLLWVDHSASDLEVLYAQSTGFTDGPLTSQSFIDDSTGADQSEPTLATYSTNSRTHVFACWTDNRSIAGSTDTDLYFADLETGTAHTNVLVGDDSTNSNQSQPCISVDNLGFPYVVWSDDRDGANSIYYVGNTYINPTPFKSSLIVAGTGGTVGTAPASIDDTTDVSVQVPANASATDVTVSISEIENPPALDQPMIAAYDFGPSNIDFDEPVTITIPYAVSDASASAYPYWYDSLTAGLSQQGITDIQRIVISDTIQALTFKTTHFTPYYLVSVPASSGGSGGGGGGCALAPTYTPTNPVDFFLPFGGLMLVMATLRYRDRKTV